MEGAVTSHAAKVNILVFSVRATCPATIHDKAVAAARAPICRNGPVA